MCRADIGNAPSRSSWPSYNARPFVKALFVIYLGAMRPVLTMLAGVLVLGVAACEKRHPDDQHWYDATKAESSQREAFVEFQQEHGLSEAEAKRAFDHMDSIEKTVGRHRTVSVRGDDLDVEP